MTGNLGDYWGGDVLYSHFQPFYQKPGNSDIKRDLSAAKELLLRGSTTLKIARIQVHGCCGNGILNFAAFKHALSKPDFFLVLVMTSDGCWWVLDIDCSRMEPPGQLHIGRLDDYNPDSVFGEGGVGDLGRGVVFGTFSWIVRSDESNSSVEQLFRWLDQKYILETQFESKPADSELFAKEMFNKFAKTKCWERLQGILRSPGKQCTGDEWLGVIRYIDLDGRHDFEDGQIGELQDKVDPSGTCLITAVYAYKIPLNEKYWTNMVLFHSYVVFQSSDTSGREWWWSLEKNCSYIALQKGLVKEDVKDVLGQEKRCESWFYWRPQLIGQDKCSEQSSVRDLLDILYQNDELGIKYHGTNENCQTFAKVIFDKLAVSKTLDYGKLPSIVNGVSRRLTGSRDPRPKKTQ